MRYTVWSHPVQFTYTTSILSRATVFHILATLLTIIPPLLMSYRSQGFWLRTATYREQPEIHFKHEVIMLADLAKGGQVGWATFNTVNDFLVENVRIPVIKSREEDNNRDGVLDGLTISMQMPVRPEEKVVGVTAILLFDIKLHMFSSVSMTGMVLLSGSGYSGSMVDMVGDMTMVQREPLAHRGRDTRYLDSPVPQDSELPEDFHIPAILKAYSERNISVRLENSYTTWSPGRGLPHFTLSATIRYPVQTLSYTPGFWQVIKWGWVQYLSVLLVFMYVATSIKTFVFSQQILPTLVTQPWKQ